MAEVKKIEELVSLNSEAETAMFAKKLALETTFGKTILLSGELGAGKTTFTRYFVEALKISTPVSSPTYVLQHEYKSQDGRTIEHWDLYRVSEVPMELQEPTDKNTLRIVEWGDKFPEFENHCEIKIRFLVEGENSRSVRIVRRQ